jgi:CDP-6-deoxy-D-xylo-4-hexulose-3-dehydrase
MTQAEQLKQEILNKTKEYYELVHKPVQERKFVDGESRVNYAGRVFDETEMQYLVETTSKIFRCF